MLFFSSPQSPLRPEPTPAELIQSILDSTPALPENVRAELEKTADVLAHNASTDQEIREALERVEEEIEAARDALADERPETEIVDPNCTHYPQRAIRYQRKKLPNRRPLSLHQLRRQNHPTQGEKSRARRKKIKRLRTRRSRRKRRKNSRRMRAALKERSNRRRGILKTAMAILAESLALVKRGRALERILVTKRDHQAVQGRALSRNRREKKGQAKAGSRTLRQKIKRVVSKDKQNPERAVSASNWV